jgi:hypothetical protein
LAPIKKKLLGPLKLNLKWVKEEDYLKEIKDIWVSYNSSSKDLVTL